MSSSTLRAKRAHGVRQGVRVWGAQSAAPFEPEALEGRVLFSTYTVTTLGDSAGSVTPNGTGKFNATTLRAALNAANAHAGADTVNFAAGLVGTINLGSALPAVTDALTLQGPGASKLTVQRSSTAATKFSVFHVNLGRTVALSGLKVSGGAGDSGGGVYNAGTLRLTNVTFTGNKANNGGGVYNTGNLGKLYVSGCTFSGNSAVYDGGAIDNQGGTISVADSLLTGNSVTYPVSDNTGASYGGAIFNDHGSATIEKTAITANRSTGSGGGITNFYGSVYVSNSYVANNSADAFDGGGIENLFPGAKTSLVNCTLWGNTANQSDGGAVYNTETLIMSGCTVAYNKAERNGGGIDQVQGTATLSNCTFYGNAAGNFAGGIILWSASTSSATLTNCTLTANSANGYAGGIYVSSGNSLTLFNSIVAGNLSSAAQPGDVLGVDADAASAYNVIGTGGSGGLVDGKNGNQVGVSLSALKLGPLASNGGRTQTVALLAGSPAIDAGSSALATAAKLFADQRGLPRVRGARVDVGAFEVQGSGGGSIAGTFFNDKNHDGVRQSTEPPLSDWQVYLDQNNNGVYDPGEQTAFTSSTGTYKFTGLAAGTYRVREVRPDGWVRTKPAGVYPLGYYDVTINPAVNGGAVAGKDFGNYLG